MNTTLPQGPEYDNYNMSMFVKIIDDTNGATIFNILTPINVKPDTVFTNSLLDDILNSNTSSQANKNLFSGDLRKTSNTISLLSQLLNSQSLNDKNSIDGSSTSTFVTTFGPELNISFSSTFENLRNITPQYSGFGTVTRLT